MVHLQDVVKLHTFVLGHLGALLLECFGFDLRFALVAFDLVSDSIWCEGVGVGVGARGGSTWAGEDYLRGALGWERRANLRTTNKARSHTHTSSSHSTTSPWSPDPYPHCDSTRLTQPGGVALNKEATTKNRVTLPTTFDLRAVYFRRHPCRCCGYKAPSLPPSARV